MALIRHKTTDVELDVPDAAVPYFPDYQLVVASSDIPPRRGAGSGRDAWADYAARSNVEIAVEATRDDIIAALDEAGVPTEIKE